MRRALAVIRALARTCHSLLVLAVTAIAPGLVIGTDRRQGNEWFDRAEVASVGP
jgi:hypothetical protein